MNLSKKLLSEKMWKLFNDSAPKGVKARHIPVNALNKFSVENNEANHRSETRLINILDQVDFLKSYKDYEVLCNFPIENRYLGDFVLLAHMVVIEVDGSIHDLDTVKRRDSRKEHWLKMAGWTVIRLNTKNTNDQWLAKLDREFRSLGSFYDLKAKFRRKLTSIRKLSKSLEVQTCNQRNSD